MTSWHGNVFRVIGPLWKERIHRSPGDSPGKARDADRALMFFKVNLNKRSRGRWTEMSWSSFNVRVINWLTRQVLRPEYSRETSPIPVLFVPPRDQQSLYWLFIIWIFLLYPPQRSWGGVYWIHPVRPSVCPSVCPPVRPSVRPSVGRCPDDNSNSFQWI